MRPTRRRTRGRESRRSAAGSCRPRPSWSRPWRASGWWRSRSSRRREPSGRALASETGRGGSADLCRFVVLVDETDVDLQRAAEDLGVAPGELDRFFYPRQLQDREAADELLRLDERAVHHTQVIAGEDEALALGARLQPERADKHASLGHLGLEAREAGLLLRGSAAGLGGLVRLLDEEDLQRGILRRRHEADIPWLVDLAELELTLAEDLAVTLRPADRLLARADLEQQGRRGQLAFAAIGTLLCRALPVAEDQTGSRLAPAEAGAVDEPTRLGVLADERPHLVDHFHRGRLPRLSVRIVLVHHH